MSYSSEISREIILDHVKNPRNKNKEHQNYKEYTLKNPSCGDIVTVYLKLNDNNIEDITYNVEGCSICTSSTSIMSELLINKTLEEVKEIIENINNMVTGMEYKEDILLEANAMGGIKDVPTRIKCATLPFKAVIEALGDQNGL